MHKQGSQEWFDARLGKVTASRFNDLLTKPRSKKDQEAGNLSKTANSYLLELISELLTGEGKSFSNEALEWGTENEPLAREEYELSTFNEVSEVGFIDHPTIANVGGSPDGLVGDGGMIEIKCPYNSNNHVKYLIGDAPISKAYYAQMQGNLWINGREWCDFVSFDPRIKGKNKIYIRRIERDEQFIPGLEMSILSFIEKLERFKTLLIK